VDRTYLYVPPEEKAEVKALGAQWDDRLKCWYILCDEDPAKFAKWLGEDDSEDEFTITSDEAFVASATIACWKCHASIATTHAPALLPAVQEALKAFPAPSQ
jgi:Domain of unknown function (DUF5710)